MIVVAIVAIVVATAPAPTQIMLRNVVYSDVQQADQRAQAARLRKHQIALVAAATRAPTAQC